MPTVYVSAGSNVEPIARLAQAAALLRQTWPGARFSRAFRNAAAGFKGEDFVNLALAFETDQALQAVLQRLHEIEGACGRARDAAKWAPRAMDLDVLLFGDLVGEFPGARLPRPDLLKRAYMLGPMAELAGQVRHPVTGRTLSDHWRDFDRAAHPLVPVSVPGLEDATC